MRLSLDRSLPVPVSAQLQGQIEYGVACGEFLPGSRLPSIRELAEELGVSPVTVSQVYKSLQDKGLIFTKPGAGTFVSRELATDDVARPSLLDRLLDRLVTEAEREGLSRTELINLVSWRLHEPFRDAPPLRLVFIGTFLEASRAYAADVGRYLRPQDDLQVLTLEQLQATHGEQEKPLRHVDLAITFAYRVEEVRRHLQPQAPEATVTELNFIPSERTRTSLAAIDPRARVGLIATFPEFLAALKHGVQRYAPHIRYLEADVLHGGRVARLLEQSDVIVYATGSDEVLQALPSRLPAIEYRHVPDPVDIEIRLLPLLDELRRDRARRDRLASTGNVAASRERKSA